MIKIKTHDNQFGHHIFIEDTNRQESICLSGITPEEKDKLLEEIRPTGEWILWTDDRKDYIKCPFCGYGDEGEIKADEGTPFCPQCGAYLQNYNSIFQS